MKKALHGKWLIFIALATTTMVMWANTINQVCLDAIYTEFANSSVFLQGYIVGGTSFVSLGCALLVGILSRKISNKILLIAGLILYLVGGVGGAFSADMTTYAIFRSLVGGATGILSTVVFSIMFEQFPNADDSAAVMGTFQVINTLMGAGISSLSGILCTMSWRSAQWINAAAIIALICVVIFIPRKAAAVSEEDTSAMSENTEDGSVLTKVDGGRVAFTLVEACLSIIFISIIQYFLAVYLSERSLGDSAITGTLMSVSTITGAVINVFFAKLFGKFKRYTGILIVLIFGIASIILGFDVPLWFVYVAMGINGFASGIIYSYYPLAINEYVTPDKITLFQSFFQATMYIGLFVPSYLPALFSAIFGGAYQRLMLTSGITMVVFALVVILLVKVWVGRVSKSTAENNH